MTGRSRLEARTWLLFASVTLGITSGCDDDKRKHVDVVDAGFDGGPAPVDSGNPTTQQDAGSDSATGRENQVTGQFTASYASVASIDLAALELPSTLTTDSVQVLSGTAEGLGVYDGFLRFLTPSDPGNDTLVELRVALENKDVTIPVLVLSARPTEVVAYVEVPDGEEDGVKVPTLAVSGMGPRNALLGGKLSFSVASSPDLDAEASSGTVTFANPASETYVTLDLSDYWTYDAATKSLTVDETKMTELLAKLPAADMEFDVALTSVDGEFAYAWTFFAHKPIAKLLGQMTDLEGQATQALTGRKVAVRGLKDNRTRLVAEVQATGAFEVNGLPNGTYEVALLDSATPEFWKASFLIEGSSEVQLDLPYAPDAVAKSKKKQDVVEVEAHLVQNNPPKAAYRAVPKAATPSGCEAVAEDGTATFVAAAGNENETISCLAKHTVAKGTAKIGVKVDVFSEEYPDYTTQKSRYNDTWSYAVAGINGFGSASAAVNDSHYTQGTVTKEACVDVSAQTGAQDYVFTASLAATNIGDSALDTTVTLTVSPTCSDKLTVTKAEFLSPNKPNYHVIRPIGPGNLANNYISIPITTAVTNWGVPLNIRYEPKDAVIKKVRMGVMVDGKPFMVDVDLLPQVTSKSEGLLKFADLLIPAFAGLERFSGKTNVIFELTGDVEGSESISKPEDGAAVFNLQKAFVPLFLANDFVGAERRYGARDNGGDSWSTHGTLEWLLAKAYRFDDTTGLHAPQLANGRSALDHAGHSDGTQVDLRYADGLGGFSEGLGGAGSGATIKKMLDDAAVEVAAGTLNGPELAKAQAWIQANRTNMELEAADARKIYAGPSWMKLALFDGKFPNGTTAIPGVTKWDTKPGVVSFVQPHLHHWHVSRSGI